MTQSKPRTTTMLRTRIVLVTFAVSLIAVLVTALVASQVVQRIDRQHARAQLIAQAKALASAESTTYNVVAGARFARVSPEGSVSGPDAAVIPEAAIRDLLAGRTVSTTMKLRHESVMVVGVPARDGGGVIAIRKLADIASGDVDLLRGIIFSLIIGLIIAMIAGVVLGRWLARPLGALASGARQLAQGQRGVVLEPLSIREFDDIAHALRHLDQALSVSESRQREFLLSVSHDIRTPLTAIRGYAEALADGLLSSEQSASAGKVLVSEANRLRRFVDDLLELARLEADDFTITKQPVGVCDLVRGVETTWSAAARRGGVDIDLVLPPAPLTVMTDDMRLRQVLDGLMENALRVAPENSTIRVSVSESCADKSRVVHIDVQDDGPGLKNDDVAVAFDRGVLHERYRHSRPVGTGLGLSIAHGLVSRLGGVITAQPVSGRGAIFRVTLPLH